MESQFVENVAHQLRATKKIWFPRPSSLSTKLYAPFNSDKHLIRSHKDIILDLEYLYMNMDGIQCSSNAINIMVNIDEIAYQREKMVTLLNMK